MTQIKAAITGVQGYVPDYVLTNQELETMVDTNDEWITSRTGIKERRTLKGENQGTSVMAVEAVNGLLKKTGTNPEEVELLICATVTPDLVFPATANVITNKVGANIGGRYNIDNIDNPKLPMAVIAQIQYRRPRRHKKYHTY